MASSSSSVLDKFYKYDVFLSFSGEDTRKTFVDHLYAALDQQGICTFKDDERLEKGKNISNDLLQSIEDSRFYIIVFSKNYASSSWCLNELLKIMECCHKTNECTAFPVFYDVDPSEVRKQNGLVGKALATQKNTNDSEVRKWRVALKEAADLSGWDLKKTVDGHEAKVIKLIVERVVRDLSSIDDTPDDENLIGMKQRVQELKVCLNISSDDVRMIGIKGMGGAGKTTLAQAIFDKLSRNFEGSSFVENVRERASQSGLNKLQEQILKDVLKDDKISVSGVHEGKNLLKKKLCGKKLLVVLDDVDREEQLEVLAGDPNWFKSGSRIIITTRDEQVLNTYMVKSIIDANLLSDEEAFRLFNMHAFGRTIPTKEYETESHEVVRYAAGLPLTIKVLGSSLRGKTKAEWTDKISRLKTIPLNETLKKLELSYDSLEDDYKEIFLDVACLLRHWLKDDALRMLESRGFHATNGLRVLEQKSLIKIVRTERTLFSDDEERIQMHDHIVEMGENIVGRGSLDEPKTHSRLWVRDDKIKVLVNDLCTRYEETSCMRIDNTHWTVLDGLRNMKKLRFLIINYYEGSHYFFDDSHVVTNKAGQYFPNSLQYLYWNEYPHRCLPNTFEANNLITLEMPYSGMEQLFKGRIWKRGQIMKKLKFINLSNNRKLKRLDLGMTPNLERLDLGHCEKLVKLDVHGGCLKTLVYLNIGWCENLESILFIEQLESLQVLDMSNLNLREIPDCITKGHFFINSLLELNLSFNDNIEEVALSIGNLQKLVSLSLEGCSSLKFLPGSIWSLKHLRTLNLGGCRRCTSLEFLPAGLGQLECLETLNLMYTKVKHLPNNIGMLKHLKTLILKRCNFLEKLPHAICNLRRLEELDLQECWRLTELPYYLGDLECLKILNISYSDITLLPPRISLLKGLKIIRGSVLGYDSN